MTAARPRLGPFGSPSGGQSAPKKVTEYTLFCSKIPRNPQGNNDRQTTQNQLEQRLEAEPKAALGLPQVPPLIGRAWPGEPGISGRWPSGDGLARGRQIEIYSRKDL